MKAISKSVTLTFIVGLLVAGGLAAQDTPEAVSIDDVPYRAMLDGFCAMSSLGMNLGHLDHSVAHAQLLNMGWSYGFFVWPTEEQYWAYPNTSPVEEIVFAAEQLGYEAKLHHHQNLDAARKTLVTQLALGNPVIIQWIGHTVLAIGYEEGGDVIIYHDPTDPKVNLKDDGAGVEFSAASSQSRVATWDQPPFLWGEFGYLCLVLKPADKKKPIDWRVIWTKNASKTLGKIKDPYPAHYGIDGLAVLIGDLNTKSFASDKELAAFLYQLEGLFYLGTGFRREAAAFLAGQASITNNQHLVGAAISFRESAHTFRSGYNLILDLKKDPSLAKGTRTQVLRLLHSLMASETRGANRLLAAVQASQAGK
ncbi:MAG: hypothetical protein GY906_33020 [bacterium]|nr:hypothetical protein [bacterium]